MKKKPKWKRKRDLKPGNPVMKDIFIRARNRLAQPGAWTKGVYARTADGRGSLGWLPESEVCWCAIGALRAECPGKWDEATALLAEEVGNVHVFNDAQETVQPVLEAYDRVIAKL